MSLSLVPQERKDQRQDQGSTNSRRAQWNYFHHPGCLEGREFPRWRPYPDNSSDQSSCSWHLCNSSTPLIRTLVGNKARQEEGMKYLMEIYCTRGQQGLRTHCHSKIHHHLYQSYSERREKKSNWHRKRIMFPSLPLS